MADPLRQVSSHCPAARAWIAPGGQLPDGCKKGKETWSFSYTVPVTITYPSGTVKEESRSIGFGGTPADLLISPETKALLDQGEEIRATVREDHGVNGIRDFFKMYRRHPGDSIGGTLLGADAGALVGLVGSLGVLLIWDAISATGSGASMAILWGSIAAGVIAGGILGPLLSKNTRATEGIIRQERKCGEAPRLVFVPDQANQNDQGEESFLLETPEPHAPSAPAPKEEATPLTLPPAGQPVPAWFLSGAATTSAPTAVGGTGGRA